MSTAVAASGQVPRTVHVEHCMGTVFSIDIRDTDVRDADIRDAGQWADAVADIVSWLHHVDAVFSTYRPDSDVSRIRRGELTLEDADPQVVDVAALCRRVSEETGGWFDAYRDGRFDPTGLVKGWAVEQASRRLRTWGSTNHSVNGGGDVQLAGAAGPGRPWRVGISDPRARNRVLTVVSGCDLAVASSGTAERGAHIVDPHTGRAAQQLAGVTVVGPELTRVDAYATAAFARGPGAVAWVEGLDGFEALAVGLDGTVQVTSGFERLTAP